MNDPQWVQVHQPKGIAYQDFRDDRYSAQQVVYNQPLTDNGAPVPTSRNCPDGTVLTNPNAECYTPPT